MSRAFFRYAIPVERLTPDAGADTEGYAAHGTIYGYVASLGAQEAMLSEGNPAQQAALFAEEQSDIKVGDRIEYGGEKYTVSGVKKPASLFSIRYKRCVIQKMLS